MKIIPFLSVLKSIFIPVSFKLSFSKQIFLKAKNPFSPLCRFFCTNMIFPVFQKDHIAFPGRTFNIFKSNFPFFAVFIFTNRNSVFNPVN